MRPAPDEAPFGSGGRRTRVLLVDDHPFVRDGLAGLLGSRTDYAVVGEAATTAEAIQLLETKQPDLIIVDLRLPDEDGVKVLKAADAMRWTVYAVVLSAFRSEDDLIAAARAGARAFLTKTARAEEVLEMLDRVMTGENVLRQELPRKLRLRLSQKDLTAKEMVILRLLGTGMTNKEIERATNLSPNTVKAHLRNIFEKLGVANRAEAAAIAVRRGLVS
jgi:DNA-binding NarL/FixJ family response regulator